MKKTCACGATWTGQQKCHCAACHRTFSGLTTFDKHRTYVEGADRRLCRDDDALAKLKITPREDGTYGGPPLTDEQKAARGWVA